MVPGPCPEIVERDGKSLCGLVLKEQQQGVYDLQFRLGIGTGCSMIDDDTTDEEVAQHDAFSLLFVRREKARFYESIAANAEARTRAEISS